MDGGAVRKLCCSASALPRMLCSSIVRRSGPLICWKTSRRRERSASSGGGLPRQVAMVASATVRPSTTTGSRATPVAPASRSHRTETSESPSPGGPSGGKTSSRASWLSMARWATGPSTKSASSGGMEGSPGASPTRSGDVAAGASAGRTPASTPSTRRKMATASASSGTTAAAVVRKASERSRAAGTAAIRASNFSRIRARQCSSASVAVPTNSTSPSSSTTGAAMILTWRKRSTAPSSRTLTIVSSEDRCCVALRHARWNQSRSLGCTASIHEVSVPGVHSFSAIPPPDNRVTTPPGDITHTDCGTAPMSAWYRLRRRSSFTAVPSAAGQTSPTAGAAAQRPLPPALIGSARPTLHAAPVDHHHS
ncbi:hypothetical protein M2436_007045 [Streptomyces sp. HB372]|nr:hypothetical protein [Streptomyces sp. HB372]